MALLKTYELTELYFPAFDSDIFADLKQYLKIQRNR